MMPPTRLSPPGVLHACYCTIALSCGKGCCLHEKFWRYYECWRCLCVSFEPTTAFSISWTEAGSSLFVQLLVPPLPGSRWHTNAQASRLQPSHMLNKQEPFSTTLISLYFTLIKMCRTKLQRRWLWTFENCMVHDSSENKHGSILDPDQQGLKRRKLVQSYFGKKSYFSREENL